MDVHGIVRQLTEWHTNRQPYTHELNGIAYTTAHTTKVPPLIQQLAEAEPSSQGGSQRSTPGSRPAARIDALDTLIHIDMAAARWVRELGEDDPGSTIACVRKLYGLAASAHHCGHDKATKDGRKVTCCTVHKIERDFRTWWTQARIVSGWDTAAWAPNNTCPIPECGVRRSLRVRVDEKTAMCMECRETWDAGTIGILAEHIRAENNDREPINGEEPAA